MSDLTSEVIVSNSSKSVTALNETSHLFRFSLIGESATEKEAQFIIASEEKKSIKNFFNDRSSLEDFKKQHNNKTIETSL